MKLRPGLYDGYVIHKIIAGEFDYLGGMQLHCYTDVLTKRVSFLITCREDHYSSNHYNTLQDAIRAWNKYQDSNNDN